MIVRQPCCLFSPGTTGCTPEFCVSWILLHIPLPLGFLWLLVSHHDPPWSLSCESTLRMWCCPSWIVSNPLLLRVRQWCLSKVKLCSRRAPGGCLTCGIGDLLVSSNATLILHGCTPLVLPGTSPINKLELVCNMQFNLCLSRRSPTLGFFSLILGRRCRFAGCWWDVDYYSLLWNVAHVDDWGNGARAVLSWRRGWVSRLLSLAFLRSFFCYLSSHLFPLSTLWIYWWGGIWLDVWNLTSFPRSS